MVNNEMNLPKAIDFSNLIETIVEIRLVPNPDISLNLWAGLLVSRLGEIGFQYQSIPQLNVVHEEDNSIKLTVEKDNGISAVNLFVNEEDGVRLIINGTTLSFNCNKGKYIGWESYLKKITEVLQIIDTVNIALSYERTMIRYISEYDFNILEKVDIDVNTHSDSRYNTLEISLSRQEGSINAYISISGLRERLSRATKETRVSSLFDVNVFDRLPEESTHNDVVNSLCKIHRIEKESFFGMLKKDYVESLNPIY